MTLPPSVSVSSDRVRRLPGGVWPNSGRPIPSERAGRDLVRGDASEARPVLETHDLAKCFGTVDAVAGLSLSVPRGGVYGFLGPNGAGKTTTLRMVLALVHPSHGFVSLFGQRVVPGADALERVGALIERPAFYRYLSAADNLEIIARLRGMAAARIAERIDACLAGVGLTWAATRRVGGFSTGMRQRLGIAAALLDRPELVVLDEPTSGLDPRGVVEVRSLIREVANNGTTVVLSSHALSEVERLCDRVAILDRGRLIAEGETNAMLRQDERLFLGFDSNRDALRALPILEGLAYVDSAEPAPEDGARAGLLVACPGSRASSIVRVLGEAQIYPSELSTRRSSLESLFLNLTDARAEETYPTQ